MPTDYFNEVGVEGVEANPIGTGPFKFVEWIPGDRIVYTRNEEYWGEKPEWEKVILKPISNSSARVAALLAGDVDLIDFVPTADIERLEKNAKLAIARSVSNRVIYLHIDSDRDVSPFVTDLNGNPMTKNPNNRAVTILVRL